jgi:hypothetical protein
VTVLPKSSVTVSGNPVSARVVEVRNDISRRVRIVGADLQANMDGYSIHGLFKLN